MTDRQQDLDREVDLLADAADGEAIDAEDRRVPPSFAAVLARAHRIDPSAVDGDALDRVADPPARAPAADPDRLLETLVAAARAEAESSVGQRRARPAPALRRPTRRGAAVIVGTLAAASAVAAAVSLAISLQGDALDRDADRDSGSLAAARAEQDDAGGIAVNGAPAPSPRPRAARARSTPEPAVEVAVEVVPEVEVGPEYEVEPEVEPRRHAEPNRAGDSRSRLERLDDRAREALAAGDMKDADDLLAKLILHGGQHRLVEAAFGDRFAIAHRLHSAAEQRKLWRSYLERFPEGRFADDARAGLCRRAPQNAAACWSAYLDDFPRGTYRAQAERVLAEDGS